MLSVYCMRPADGGVRNAHLATSSLGSTATRSTLIMAAPPSPDKKKKGGKVSSHRDKLPP
jgi:hypothetical protein